MSLTREKQSAFSIIDGQKLSISSSSHSSNSSSSSDSSSPSSSPVIHPISPLFQLAKRRLGFNHALSIKLFNTFKSETSGGDADFSYDETTQPLSPSMVTTDIDDSSSPFSVSSMASPATLANQTSEISLPDKVYPDDDFFQSPEIENIIKIIADNIISDDKFVNLSKEVKDQIKKNGAIKRSIKHIIVETLDVLALALADPTSPFILHYEHKIPESMAYVLQEAKALGVHVDISVISAKDWNDEKHESLFNKLLVLNSKNQYPKYLDGTRKPLNLDSNSRVFIATCPGFDSISGDKIKNTVDFYVKKKKSNENIYFLISEYNNVNEKVKHLERKGRETYIAWLRQNQPYLGELPILFRQNFLKRDPNPEHPVNKARELMFNLLKEALTEFNENPNEPDKIMGLLIKDVIAYLSKAMSLKKVTKEKTPTVSIKHSQSLDQVQSNEQIRVPSPIQTTSPPLAGVTQSPPTSSSAMVYLQLGGGQTVLLPSLAVTTVRPLSPEKLVLSPTAREDNTKVNQSTFIKAVGDKIGDYAREFDDESKFNMAVTALIRTIKETNDIQLSNNPYVTFNNTATTKSSKVKKIIDERKENNDNDAVDIVKEVRFSCT